MFGRNKQTAEDDAPLVEIWAQLVENNLFLRRTAMTCIVFGFFGLCLGAYGVEVALYRPLAFHVDEAGQATFVGRLREQLVPSSAEVRFVAKDFLKHYLALSSLTLESDLASAWNFMTEDLRREHEQMLARFEKENGEDFVSNVRKQGIQTLLVFDDKRTEIAAHNDKQFTVHLHGTARIWPLNRIGEDAAFEERTFDAHLLLVRCPRTEQTPNGLLVSKVSRRLTTDSAHDEPASSSKEK